MIANVLPVFFWRKTTHLGKAPANVRKRNTQSARYRRQ